MKLIDPRLHERLSTLISSMGYELVGCEQQSQGRQTLLRIYIDSSQGVTVDACSQISHQVSAMMDVEDPIQGNYTLEVSSPGINRRLFTIEHYPKFIGCQVQIRLYTAIQERKQFKGVLTRVEGNNVFILMDNVVQEIMLPFSAIEKAHLIGDVPFPKLKKK